VRLEERRDVSRVIGAVARDEEITGNLAGPSTRSIAA
jgi:hypothetical protein